MENKIQHILLVLIFLVRLLQEIYLPLKHIREPENIMRIQK